MHFDFAFHALCFSIFSNIIFLYFCFDFALYFITFSVSTSFCICISFQIFHDDESWNVGNIFKNFYLIASDPTGEKNNILDYTKVAEVKFCTTIKTHINEGDSAKTIHQKVMTFEEYRKDMMVIFSDAKIAKNYFRKSLIEDV